MAIKEAPVDVVYVQLICDVENCSGEMLPTGMALMSSPPQYPHKCNVCGVEVNQLVKYPKLDYRVKVSD